MKRQFAMLFALTFLVSGMATFAEEAAVNNENTQIEMTEAGAAESLEWTLPFEDGEWMSIPEWNAELYLPLGWQLFEVTENGFIAADAEAASLVTVVIEDFITEEAAETEEAEANAAAETEETAETEEIAENAEPSAFESYLMGLGQEYELNQVGEREMGVLIGEESVTVKFVMNDKLVTMDFTPAVEGSIADSALSIAETFYLYEVDEVEEIAEETAEEAAAEETAE